MSATGLAASLFRVLLYASPGSFRREYGAQIRDDFDDALRDEGRAHGAFAATAFALAAYADIVWTGVREYGQMIWRDLVFAVRSLRRTPLFAFVAIATLALAIGANATAFSILRAVVLAPLPYADPDRLVAVQVSEHGKFSRWSLPNYADVAGETPAFARSAAYVNTGATLTGAGSPQHLDGFAITAGFFDVLQTRPELGRFFTRRDARPGTHDVIVSDGFWRRTLHAAPTAIGGTLRLDGVAYRIVGIAPAKLAQPGMDRGFTNPSYWIVLPDDGTGTQYHNRSFNVFAMIARLHAGESLDVARAQLTVAQKRLSRKYPDDDRGIVYTPLSLTDALVGSMRVVLFAIFAAVTGVLLIACANVGNLLLSRAAARTRELALRTALGASRRRLIAQLLVETFALALAGGATGLVLAWGAVEAFAGLAPSDIPRVADVTLDGTAVLYTFGAVIFCTLFAGLAPALFSSTRNLVGALKAGGRGGDAASGRHARNALVAFEIALTLALVVAAGLVLRSFISLTSQPLGFEPSGVTVVGRVQIPHDRYPTDQSVADFMARVIAKASALPGVHDVAWAIAPPFERTQIGVVFQLLAERPAPRGDEPTTAVNLIDPHYFVTLRQPLERGRAFTSDDQLTSANVAIVNAAFVRRFISRGDALGRRMTVGISATGHSGPRTIVGVAGDTRTSYALPPEPTVYLPAQQVPFPDMALVVRGDGAAAKAVAAVVPSVDPLMPVPAQHTLASLMAEDTARARLGVASIGALAFVALSLALAGIYAVVSYGVAQRTQELGVRMALGARATHVVRDVVTRALGITGIGVSAGIVLAVFAARAIADQLYGVAPFDPATFAIVIIAIVLASAAAALIPARRATRVDPIVALRYE